VPWVLLLFVVGDKLSLAGATTEGLPRNAIINFRFDHQLINIMSYKDTITIEPGKRSGKPCIRGMRITVYDVLSYLASGMTYEEILEDFPYLTKADILACLSYAAERERQTILVN
jgi:uncharacterized protein (DUF433 family)